MRRLFYLGLSDDFPVSSYDHNHSFSLVSGDSLDDFIVKKRIVKFDLLLISDAVGWLCVGNWLERLEGITRIPPVVILSDKSDHLPSSVIKSSLIKGITKKEGTLDDLLNRLKEFLVPPTGSAMYCCDPCSMGIVGLSSAVAEVKEQIEKYASHRNMPVLILGENGTGKELVARALFNEGHDSKSPFVKTQVSANGGDGLFESVMFGVKEGAYTGATNRIGLLEQADGGVLYLDEIGTLSMKNQVALLRVLEEKTLRPLGSSEEIYTDFRLISATNESFPDSIDKGLFRRDLFHRINTLIIHVPPLRDRIEDIPLLVSYFLEKEQGRRDITSGAIKKLLAHSWPGNIRELRNTLQRAVAESGKRIMIESRDVIIF